MAKRNSKRRRNKQRNRQPTPSIPAAAPGIAAGAYVWGIGLLALCVATSLVLALEHIGGLHLPGCGEGSRCAEAAASVWGKIPYVNWPVSFVGLAYFLGLAVVWVTARRSLPSGVRNLVRCGALISLGFVVIMIVEGHVCSYCLATHVANLAFWILTERVAGATTGTARAFATIAVVFALSSAVLGTTEWRERKAAQAAAEGELAESTAAIIAATSQQAAAPEVAFETSAPGTAATEPAEPGVTSEPRTAGGGFSGRHRLGPEKAAIRVVLFSDYQCKECKQIEADVIEVFEQRDDMSVSFQHYPMNSECNRMVKRSRHPNACWAARAAETAGILRGNDGFWEMHFWLFEHGGSFTRTELRAALREFGYGVAEFERIMQSEETLRLVRADVEEAIGLGIWQTPAVFVNGVELRGWEAPRAVARAIERLAATNPTPMTAALDQPPPALEKLIGDWQAQPRRRIPPGATSRSLGPNTASVRVVIFGDYQQSGTAETDAVVRDEVSRRGDVRYEYRHFPFNKDCNPAVQKETKYPHACQAAQAAEAVASLVGAEGYWKMHLWLLGHQEAFSGAALREAASEIGIDPAVLLAEMERPEIRAAVVEDAKLGQRLGVSAVPSVFVNGRRVPRWKLEGENILPRIIDQAAKE